VCTVQPLGSVLTCDPLLPQAQALCPSAWPAARWGCASWSAWWRGRHTTHALLLLLAVAVQAMGIHLLVTVLPSVVADIGDAAFYSWAPRWFHHGVLYSQESTPMTTKRPKITRLNTGLGIIRCTLPPKYIPIPMPGNAQRNSSNTKGVNSLATPWLAMVAK
jgi:hypothetical protein